MNRNFAFALAALALLGFSASQAFARGGHGGGGHHGGSHHSGHHNNHHASHHHHSGQHSHHNHHHSVAHHGNHHPFSHGWAGHHGAWGWGAGGYGWGNPWAAASLGAAAGWLGASALEGGYGYGGGGDTNVYTADNSTPDDNQSGESQQFADNGNDADNQADEGGNDLQPSAELAGQLAAAGADEPGKNAQFLPLGVYSIAPAGADEANNLVQLAVSKEGVLRGSFFDTATDKNQNVQGAIDKNTGRVAWTVGNNKEVFETSLADLTEQSGPVTVHAGNGKSSEWTIAHYNSENNKENSPEKSNFEQRTGAVEGTLEK